MDALDKVCALAAPSYSPLEVRVRLRVRVQTLNAVRVRVRAELGLGLVPQAGYTAIMPATTIEATING